VDKYSWRDTGSSFGLADPLAAILLAQVEERDVIQGRRRAVFERYLSGLSPHADALGLTLPDVPEDREPAYHLFHVLLPEAGRRGEVIAAMKARGVPTAFHYVPLHDSDGGRRFSATPGECPTSTDVSARLLRLPFHQELEASDCDRVVAALVDVLSGM
jgi:dTDP-4-amino-4,6-dideoxygalactose transaminase